VVADGVLEENEALAVEIEEVGGDGAEHVRSPWTVEWVSSVVLTAGVVEDGEKPDHRLVGAGVARELETDVLHPLPVA
jgi:hypothetical protein